uniref:Putative secreted protein n=1 Tax=Ixodes ricinus TaxID=34613 RepID=A0A090X806_IXORI
MVDSGLSYPIFLASLLAVLTPGREGQPCNSYAPCRSDLCCLKSSRGNRPYATCQPKARYGKPCSEDAIKGGFYTLLCPCLRGDLCVPVRV